MKDITYEFLIWTKTGHGIRVDADSLPKISRENLYKNGVETCLKSLVKLTGQKWTAIQTTKLTVEPEITE